MIGIKDVIEWGVAIVIALIGVSAVKIIKRNKTEKNTVNQTISNGNNNNLAGGDISIGKNKED